MRIIAGKYKNSIIPTITGGSYRPTTAKLKEALFSIIDSLDILPDNYKALDIFAGSGALGFEALSRGASFATFIDIEHKYLASARYFAAKIGAEKNTEFLKYDATNLPLASSEYNLVFLDPPYGKNLVSASLSVLAAKKWLADKAVIAVELEKNAPLPAVKENKAGLELIKEKIYRQSKLLIYQFIASSG